MLHPGEGAGHVSPTASPGWQHGGVEPLRLKPPGFALLFIYFRRLGRSSPASPTPLPMMHAFRIK